MLPPDLAFAQAVNRASVAYTQHAPAYMAYRSSTHITVPRFNRSLDINRSVAVRVKDDAAVMQDLPSGASRTGQAFPIIAFFSPFQSFQYSYPAFLSGGRINRDFAITLKFGGAWGFDLPAADTSVDSTLFYIKYFRPVYAADSTDQAPHLHVDPVPSLSGDFYPTDLRLDPASQLPKSATFGTPRGETMQFDYAIVNGYWVIDHIAYNAISSTFIGDIKFLVDITYDGFSFPSTAPDPRLQ